MNKYMEWNGNFFAIVIALAIAFICFLAKADIKDGVYDSNFEPVGDKEIRYIEYKWGWEKPSVVVCYGDFTRVTNTIHVCDAKETAEIFAKLPKDAAESLSEYSNRVYRVDTAYERGVGLAQFGGEDVIRVEYFNKSGKSKLYRRDGTVTVADIKKDKRRED